MRCRRGSSCTCRRHSNSKTGYRQCIKYTVSLVTQYDGNIAEILSNLRARRGAGEGDAVGEAQALLARTATDLFKGHVDILRMIVVREVAVLVPATVVEGGGLTGRGGREVAAEDQRPVVRPAELRGVRIRGAVVGEAVEAAAGVSGIKGVAVQMGLAAALSDVLIAAVEVALRGVVLAIVVVEGEDVLACRDTGA